MKKILLVSAFVALSSGAAFAGSNLNNAFVGQAGFFNTAVVEQGGSHNFNNATTLQFGIGNGSIITQD